MSETGEQQDMEDTLQLLVADSPQARYMVKEASALTRHASSDEELDLRRELLALAKLQRRMHSAHPPSDPFLVATAHIKLGTCYMQRNYAQQTHFHCQAALLDLDEVSRALPLDVARTCAGQLEHLRMLANKFIGEVHMAAEPPRHLKALQSFVRALPLLAGVHVDGDVQGVLAQQSLHPDAVCALLQDLPFAASVASCFGFVAEELLSKLESAVEEFRVKRRCLADNLLALSALEQSVLPSDKGSSLESTTRNEDTFQEGLEAAMMQRLKSSADNGELPYLRGLMDTLSQYPPVQADIEHIVLAARDKLEHLCLLLQECRSKRVVVIFSTNESVAYFQMLLGMLKEQECYELANIFVLTAQAPRTKRSEEIAVFDKAKAGMLLCTEAALTTLEYKAVSRLVFYDVPPGCPLLVAPIVTRAAKSHGASVLVMLLPHEHLVVQLLRNSGSAVSAMAPLQRGQNLTTNVPLERVLRRRVFKNTALLTAGVLAFNAFVAHYRKLASNIVFPPSQLNAADLMAMFCVPSKTEAVSFMARSFASRRGQAPPTSGSSGSTAPAPDAEDIVDRGILELQGSLAESMELGCKIQKQRASLLQEQAPLVSELQQLLLLIADLPARGRAEASKAAALLSTVIATLEGHVRKSCDRHDPQHTTLAKLRQRLSEVHFCDAKVCLHDVARGTHERQLAAISRLKELLASSSERGHALALHLECNVLNLLGTTERSANCLQDAERHFVRLVKVEQERFVGAVHEREVNVAQALQSLGRVYVDMRAWEAAADAFNAALAMFQRRLVKDHPFSLDLERDMKYLIKLRQSDKALCPFTQQ